MNSHKTELLPIVFVLASLVSLALVPWLLQQRVDDLSAEISEVCDPARAMAVARLARSHRVTAMQMEEAAEERGRLLEAERRARLESEVARREAHDRRTEWERATKSRAALMRGFSHDVKNPLGAALGYLQILGKGMVGPLTDRRKESVERANRSLSAALKLIEDLLSLIQRESGRYWPTSSRMR